MHLFLLDDDDLNNEILSSVIPETGIVKKLSIYTDGWDALEFLRTCRSENEFPDLLFVDLKMPTMDGEEFIQNYEKEFYDNFPLTNLIILSNSTLSKEKNRILGYKSVLDYIIKPIDFKLLKEIFGNVERARSKSEEL